MKLRYVLFALLCVLLVAFLLNAETCTTAFFNGITLWAINVLPSLFPFAVITSLTRATAPKFKLKHSITNIAFGYGYDGTLLTSLLCGYPVGAKVISTDYNNGTITKTQAIKMCITCSTVSPVFIIGTVSKLLNLRSAVVILVCHVTATVLVGILTRSLYVDNTETQQRSCTIKPSLLSDTVLDSVTSVLVVGGLIAMFYMVCTLIESLLNFSNNQPLLGYAFGLLEMTTGIIKLSSCNIATATVLCCSLVSFGGICVITQCYSFLYKCVSFVKLLVFKACQCATATIICYVAVFVLKL